MAVRTDAQEVALVFAPLHAEDTHELELRARIPLL
jgi:hypothetical protein